VYRAYSHSSYWSQFADETNRIHDLFYKNGYPRKVINSVISSFVDGVVNNGLAPSRPRVEFEVQLPLQFRGLATRVLAKKLTSIMKNLYITYYVVKARQIFPLPRSKPSLLIRYNIIYQYKCPKCGSSYVGRTKRLFFHRLNEHQKNFIGEHHKNCQSDSQLIDCFTVIAQAKKYVDLCILESIYIMSIKPNLNTQLMHNGADHTLSIRLF